MKEILNIIPPVKSLKIIENTYLTKKISKVYFEKKLSCGVLNLLFKIFPSIVSVLQSDEADITFTEQLMEKEEYEVLVSVDQIKIRAYTDVGYYYALQSLRQIIKEEIIPCVEIKDRPDLETRGVLFDISRSKVPKLATLQEMVDLIAMLKYNHLQLYIEGFSYEYQSFRHYLRDGNYFSLAEFQELEKYANDNFIDLVPNQNGFGHMTDWLKLEEFAHLAECEEGFTIWGCHRLPSTLNPIDDQSVKLVTKMYDDMLPFFKSRYFNMNFDEPYELGYGKSKDVASRTSKEDVYLSYLNKLAPVVRKYQKTPMIWGDVVIKHPNIVEKIPQDIILIDWGYSKNYPFEPHAIMLEKLKRPYLLAGGTSTWSTITGRYDDMLHSIENASVSAKQHQGKGVLVTDWGDIGHLQYLPISYAGLIWGSITSWGSNDESLIKSFLERLVGQNNAYALLKLSTYPYLEGEYRDYGSRLFSSILWAEHASRYPNKLSFFEEKIRSNFIEFEKLSLLNQLFDECDEIVSQALKEETNNDQVSLNYLSQKIISEEIKNSIFLLKILTTINYKLQTDNQGVNFDQELINLTKYQKEHERLWKIRNKFQGFQFSNQRIEWLKEILFQKNVRGDNQ